MSKQICLKVMFLTELNPGLKVLQGILKIGKFYDLATLIKIAQWWRKLGF